MVEVIGITDDAERVVEVVLYDAPACTVRKYALQVLCSFSNTRQLLGHKKNPTKRILCIDQILKRLLSLSM